MKRFGAAALRTVDETKYFYIRCGAQHRYIAIWVVVVDGRVFVRSWNDKPTGWYKAFVAEPRGSVKIGDREVRKATIEIERHSETELEALKRNIEENSESFGSFETYLDGGEKAAWMNTTQILGGGEYDISRKLVTRGPDVWEARGSVLVDHRDELIEALESALDSVRVK